MSRMTDFCDLACDSCGIWIDTNVPTLREGRIVARKRGWRTVKTETGVEDRCPECGEKERRQNLGYTETNI